MNELTVISGPSLPAIMAAADERARFRFLEFFAAQIRNPHTRRAYVGDVSEFMAWCFDRGVRELGQITPFHVAGYVELTGKTHSAPTVKRSLSAIRRLLDWLVTGQVIPQNPATSVRAPRYSQRRGKTPILGADEARELLDVIDISTLIGMRDRALLATMLFTFGRVGAVTAMTVRDAFVRERRLWVRLYEKGGKVHEMPCNHKLEEYIYAWLEVSGLKNEFDAPLFPTIKKGTAANGAPGTLTRQHMDQKDAYRRVRKHGLAAAIASAVGNHSLRGTGITTYLQNGGDLEKAQDMANHASISTTQLYDRRSDDVMLSDVELVRI
ncbi:MAG TPA: tyrosine-type recombinase/integrase [Bosea sp. (in: a-proteobacteria)]|jgi:site-specific recombinase XerC|uniref:tyrosine-type recombinase/integrase n=1 Tax=Bosea sp. (in: a-proteobacteria) TaxID=1871050 RepID=UPI002DDD3294|nr:tyrosine-type recombinase/integrase [Bosea sp. (in: a-proteobacteria)]HEV2553231.1 tyrosine-type recombinase/integrase [Bosea sp. (in: a-proteobacteria)]